MSEAKESMEKKADEIVDWLHQNMDITSPTSCWKTEDELKRKIIVALLSVEAEVRKEIYATIPNPSFSQEEVDRLVKIKEGETLEKAAVIAESFGGVQSKAVAKHIRQANNPLTN